MCKRVGALAGRAAGEKIPSALRSPDRGGVAGQHAPNSPFGGPWHTASTKKKKSHVYDARGQHPHPNRFALRFTLQTMCPPDIDAAKAKHPINLRQRGTTLS